MKRREMLGLAPLMLMGAEGGRAGFAETDITPAIGSEIPGNYLKQYHKAMHDPCKVRAGFFEQGGKAVCLVGLDALMVPRHLVEKVRARVPGVEVMIGASHSHSSGPVGMVQPGEYDHASAEVRDLAYKISSGADPAYLKLVEDQMVRAIEQARRNATATLWGYGAGEEKSAIFNRRFRMKNGKVMTHPRAGNPDIVEAAGPVDGTVTVLGVFNESQQLTGCVVNYSCHATTSPRGISANWIYFMERLIRGTFGEGVVVVFLQGFSGDVTQVDNMDRGPVPTGVEYARLVGGRVGAEAVKVLLSMRPVTPQAIHSAAKTFFEGRRIPGAERVEAAWKTVRDSNVKRNTAEWVFAKEIVLLDALLAKQRSVAVEVQAIAIGPAVFVSAPGEMFVELGLEIRKGSPFRFTAPVSLANGCVGYVPTMEALGEKGGGYEQRLSSYTNLVPDAGPRMVREALRLVHSLPRVEVSAVPKGPEFSSPWDYGSVPGDNTAVRIQKPLVLFNGSDLTNFYHYTRESKLEDPNRVFTVRGGLLRISGEEWGGITTKEAYRDYRLVVEWKWGQKTWREREKRARDSGILIHGHGPDGSYNGIWLESFESQIIEGGSGDILVVAKDTPMSASCLCVEEGKEMYFAPKGKVMTRMKGRINWYGRSREWKDELGVRGKEDLEKAVGQWNRQEVIAAGDRMVNLLNGKVVSGAFDLSHTQGKIQVQSELAEIYVRRIELLPLTEKDWKLAESVSA
jgi:neutral ceramidase